VPLRGFLRCFGRGSPNGSDSRDDGSAEARLRAEVEGLEARLAALRSDLEGLEAAADRQARGLIPAALREPLDPLDRPVPRKAGPGSRTAGPGPASLEARRERTLETLSILEAERRIFHTLLEALRPGMAWEEAGERIRGLCQKPFELSGFYLARADPAAGLLRFPFFYEAGRPGGAEPLPFDRSSGLTGWALFEGVPCYLDSRQACEARGMRLTDAERRSGLLTQSWFGVPLGSADPPPPRGLMAFHCYHAGAFSPDRRRLMTTLARITGLYLE
jgi:hypothetical protein